MNVPMIIGSERIGKERADAINWYVGECLKHGSTILEPWYGVFRNMNGFDQERAITLLWSHPLRGIIARRVIRRQLLRIDVEEFGH